MICVINFIVNNEMAEKEDELDEVETAKALLKPH